MKYNASNYYYDGYAAYTNGLSHDQCQLEMGTTSRVDWYRGWRDAEIDNRKKPSPSEIDSSNQQFESLASKPDEVWNGDGLPPVGCEVEAMMPGKAGKQWEWRKVKVALSGIAGAEKECLVYDLETTAPAWVDEFRPIRNQEEFRREEACAAIKSIIVDFDLESIEHRGDEMEIAKEIFFSIRAGKIPHIILEAADE